MGCCRGMTRWFLAGCAPLRHWLFTPELRELRWQSRGKWCSLQGLVSGRLCESSARVRGSRCLGASHAVPVSPAPHRTPPVQHRLFARHCSAIPHVCIRIRYTHVCTHTIPHRTSQPAREARTIDCITYLDAPVYIWGVHVHCGVSYRTHPQVPLPPHCGPSLHCGSTVLMPLGARVLRGARLCARSQGGRRSTRRPAGWRRSSCDRPRSR
jgi:hypothetical protein